MISKNPKPSLLQCFVGFKGGLERSFVGFVGVDLDKCAMYPITVEGELSVANFIDNFFKGLRGKPVACVACTQRYQP